MSALAFELPPALEARQPPESRGLARDLVRLMVAHRDTGAIEHRRFEELDRILRSGDLLVINVSGTLPAALPARRPGGEAIRLHLSTRAPKLGGEFRVLELRSSDGARPVGGHSGERLELAGGGSVELVAPYASGARLHLGRFTGTGTLESYLGRHGEPIRYGHSELAWPLSAYQNVYATEPGSSEMASAGRPFTPALITQLVARGIAISPIVLHAGVSSPERHEPPFPEPYRVPAATARLVNAVRRARGRIIAVGTTVVRALETVARASGEVRPGSGWTNLVITPERGVRAVDGLITGWHEPEASHLQMLSAVAGRALLRRSYDAALGQGYLWHEFGDSHLILP